jgi:signal transduction histidine kinase
MVHAFLRVRGRRGLADRTGDVKTRAWWVFLVVMAPVVGLYLLGPGTFNSGPVFNAIGLSAVAAIIAGVRLHRPATKAAWYLIASGMALFVGGDVLAYNYERFFGRQLPFPSIADVVYLAVPPAIAAGLLLLIRQRTRGGDRASLIDALIIGTGVGLLSWVFLMAPYAHADLSVPEKLTSLAYPLTDVLLLSMAVRLAFSGGNKSRSCYLTVVAIGVLFATDATYGWLQLHGGYQPGGLLDGGWIAFYLLLGAAALHPSMAIAVGEAARTRLTRPRLVVLALATFVAPVTGLLAQTRGADRIVTAGASIVLFSLVLLRMVDVVQRHEAGAAREHALQKTAARLLELDQLKDQFVATVSHELRTPLTSIHGYLELVLQGEEELADEQREFLSVAGRNTDRLRRLVEDLLLVSELDAGELDFEFATVDFGDLARESVESARPRAVADGINLELSATSAMRLNGDRVRLGQMLDNVISNALKFTPRGGSVSVRVTQSNGSAVLEVEDTGIGIGVDEQKQLFDRFFRGRAAGERAIQGTGLGLSISQSIAQAHGGLIEVASEENVGTTFRVAFPRAG